VYKRNNVYKGTWQNENKKQNLVKENDWTEAKLLKKSVEGRDCLKHLRFEGTKLYKVYSEREKKKRTKGKEILYERNRIK